MNDSHSPTNPMEMASGYPSFLLVQMRFAIFASHVTDLPMISTIQHFGGVTPGNRNGIYKMDQPIIRLWGQSESFVGPRRPKPQIRPRDFDKCGNASPGYAQLDPPKCGDVCSCLSASNVFPVSQVDRCFCFSTSARDSGFVHYRPQLPAVIPVPIN